MKVKIGVLILISLTKKYKKVNAPITVDWDPKTNEITFIPFAQI